MHVLSPDRQSRRKRSVRYVGSGEVFFSCQLLFALGVEGAEINKKSQCNLCSVYGAIEKWEFKD
jgi:hypothetical protein